MTYPQYASYKDSGQPWLGSIPEHWVTRRVKFLFKIKKRIAGKTGFDVLSITQNGIKVKDITSGGGQLSMDYSKYQIVQKHDFAMNHMDLLTGYVDISNYDGVTSPDYRVFSLSDDEQLRSYFLYIFQMGYKNKIFFALGQGSSQLGRWRFPADEFNNFVVPLPPLEEQKAIAEFIDKKTSQIDTHIDKQERLIALLKERRTAIINKAVTRGLDENVKLKDSGIDWLGEIPEHWEVKKLKNIASFINRGTPPVYTEHSKCMVVNQATFSKRRWDKTDIRFHQTKNAHNERGALHVNDILLASTGGGVLGKAWLFEEHDGTYMADSHVTIIRDKKLRFIPKYIFNFFDINYDLINGVLSQGSTNQTELQRDWLKQFMLPVPPKSEQHEIVTHIDNQCIQIDNTITLIEKEIASLKEYRQSLISNAVTGKIKVI